MQGLTEGRIVHFVLPDDKHMANVREDAVGKHVPAMVVLVCPKSWGYPDGAVNLQLFVDGSNDIKGWNPQYGSIWATSVQYDPEGAGGTWHWIEPA